MTFDVVLSGVAVRELVQIVSTAEDKQVVLSASERIRSALTTAPRSRGRHLSEGLYVYTDEPLRAFFEIDEDEHVVEITSLRPA